MVIANIMDIKPLGLGYNNQVQPGCIEFSWIAKFIMGKSFHTDVALSLAFFNRLSGSIEYYKVSKFDFPVPLPLSAGGTVYGNSALQNIGELFNRGFKQV
jgi:hypothetical protein